jgi:glycosyltransferase involved in cell wall biosynthesis
VAQPTVTIAIPVLNEAEAIEACLDAVAAQTYDRIVEVLVVDGGSTDDTRAIVADRPGIRLIDNPRRIQAAALNIALAEAKGDVFVRVDGHCQIAPDYVEQCIEALELTGAAMVGGAMTPAAERPFQRGVAAAMSSRLGAGPARFHTGGASGRVDTVYLGAFATELGRDVGGYAEDVGVNEDAEFAIRMGARGPVWFDETITSTYMPRSSLRAVGRQFFRYGRSRAATVRKHPRSLAGRQLAAPLLVLGLLSPRRRAVAAGYLAVVALGTARKIAEDPAVGVAMAATLPTMHMCWGTGFLRGLVPARRRRS